MRIPGSLVCAAWLSASIGLAVAQEESVVVETRPPWDVVVGRVDEREVHAREVVAYVDARFAPGLLAEMATPYGDVVRRSEAYDGWIDAYLDLLALEPTVRPAVRDRAEKRFEADLTALLTERVQRTQKELVESLGLQAMVQQALPGFLRNEGLPLFVKVLAEELVDRVYDIQEVRSHFVRHAFRFGGKVKASLIFFSFQDRETGKRFDRERRAEIQERAFAVYRDLVGGADFEKLVRLHSDDEASRARGGDIGWFGFYGGALPETVLEVAFLTAPGATMRPVVTRRGVFLLRIEERRNRANPNFHAIRDEIERDYRRELARRFLIERRSTMGVRRD
ncbi:MAG: peptidylprolyl isomerase [Planctomycetes bacterium]|nr:peptidylprolyl isomerase [Planctomycetota bacterium]